MAAQEHEHHCPFLNRPDDRCAEHFHLDDLGHAFAYCFDHYAACPVYVERLVERRVRQQVSVVASEGQEHGRQTLVQITVPARFTPAGVRRRTSRDSYIAGEATASAAQSAVDAKSVATA